MKYFVLCITLLFLSCQGRKADSPPENDSTAMTQTLLERGQELLEEQNPDSALMVLLNAADYSKGCKDRHTRFDLFTCISQLYEEKNLSQLQQQYQQWMLEEARALGDIKLESEAHGRMAATHLVLGELDAAATEARTAYRLARTDTLDYRSQTLLMLCQIYLQAENTDSASFFLHEAERIDPSVQQTDLYRLSLAYVLAAEGEIPTLESRIHEDMTKSGIYTRAELARLLMQLHEDAARWRDAYDDSQVLLQLTDSISAQEASESMARIHALQHHQQMQLQAERQQTALATEHARHYLIVILILLLLLAVSITALLYRRRAKLAHAKELEAMMLAEQVQEGAELVKEENIQLQKRYYEHLYAIILPILNARRNKSGHIDLEEASWALIERNTDMVLPGFTTKLRRQHNSLTEEDIRFCCLIMMRVPTAILADVYGIAPSSVAMRKQRMKRKLNDIIENQTLENYLNQYAL